MVFDIINLTFLCSLHHKSDSVRYPNGAKAGYCNAIKPEFADIFLALDINENDLWLFNDVARCFQVSRHWHYLSYTKGVNYTFTC